MIELVRHIEYLLLDNDCVTVPELGGFIAHYQSARYVEDEGLFLPPVRTVGFNPQLCMNDGLLAQSYMQSYHTDFPDATRRISDAVCELKEILFSDGMIEIHGVGTLNYNIHGQYEFHPSECGVLSPSLYGLNSFSFPLLADEVIEVQSVAELPASDEEQLVSEQKIIRMLPPWIGHVAAVVIGFVLFFALSTPVENTYVDNGSYASLGTDCLFDEIRDYSVATSLHASADMNEQVVKAVKTETVKPVAVKNEVVKAEVKVADSKAVERIEQPVTPEVKAEPAIQKVTPVKKYHIIVSSLATSEDAAKMLKKYHNEGYAEACIKEGSGRFRIALYSFSTNADANRKLNELKKNESFKDAWLLTSK